MYHAADSVQKAAQTYSIICTRSFLVKADKTSYIVSKQNTFYISTDKQLLMPQAHILENEQNVSKYARCSGR